MIERSGTRFNKGDYFETVIDTEIPSCEVTGFIDGQPVDFSGGGGGELNFGHAVQKLTTADNAIVFNDIPAEPKCFALTTSISVNSSDTNNYLVTYAKFGDESLIKRYKHSTGEYENTGVAITASYSDGKLTFTSSSMKFSAIQGYVLVYAY